MGVLAICLNCCNVLRLVCQQGPAACDINSQSGRILRCVYVPAGVVVRSWRPFDGHGHNRHVTTDDVKIKRGFYCYIYNTKIVIDYKNNR